MTEKELGELISDCPILYHAAEAGSSSSILDHGLYSTSALLDAYGITGPERKTLEEHRRAKSVQLTKIGKPTVTLRDQLPMDDAGLARCLPPHLKPSDWYRILNTKVFFWLTRERLMRLLGAESYRGKTHDILEIETRALVSEYGDKIWLCPINSGYTKYVPQPRDENTFKRIRDYPYAEYRKRRERGECAVELAVDYAVPDISKFVRRIISMNSEAELQQLYSK